ncbi:MAG: DUF1295 domain-containing protein [Sandaracinaceae bacterium]
MLDGLAGFFTPWVVTLVVTLLHLALPGRWVVGYARDPITGERLRYRLNGILVLGVTVLGWATLGATGALPWDWLYVHRWSSFAGACTLGLGFSLALVVGAPKVTPRFAADLYLGRRDNPRLLGGRLDAKMWLYLVGAVMLELNVLSFAAHHALSYPRDPSPGVLLGAGLLTFFVLDYLTFERVHLTTYDLFAERVGIKLGWGCLAFYPYFYAVALWSVVDRPNPGTATALYAVSALLFLAGWSLSRGANLQKYLFKTRPGASFLGITPEVIEDGQRSLLVNGFWGVSRHVNYLGEVLMGIGIALSVGYVTSPGPWLYPLYYLLLLVPRERDDDARCSAKYGELWRRYRERVPYRIVPYVY